MDINYYKKYEPIDGKWYLTKELGSGAFGKVFEIERRDFTNDKSALKIITIPPTSNEVVSYREENYDLDEKSISTYFYGFVEEFTKEFSIMTQLKGQNNVVRIEDYDIIEHENEIGWDIFIRMELLTPMNKYFAKSNPTTKDVIKLGIDICKALEACQKFNIIHRDIKPSNIFVSGEGEYKLGDFGVARTLEKTSSGLSKKGTYTYMAPEVYKGEAYSSNVDTYSLGIVMYKLLNNNMEPFKQGRTHEDDEKALIARFKGEPMLKPANAEGKLAGIILKACAFNPKYRYESPAKMRAELEVLLESENEEKSILTNNENLQFEPSTIGTSASIPVPETTQNSMDGTIGIFDSTSPNSPEDIDKTVGIFDTNSNFNSENSQMCYAGDSQPVPNIEPPVYKPVEPVVAQPVKSEEKSSKRKTLMIIFISLGALLITVISIVLIVALNGSGDDRNNGTQRISSEADYYPATWGDVKVELDGWVVPVKVLDEPIANCKELTVQLEIYDVTSGDPYGNWSVYVRTLEGSWKYFTEVYYSETDYSVEKTSTFVKPTSFDAIAFTRNSDNEAEHEFDFNVVSHTEFEIEITEVDSFQVIQEPVWFNDHYIWPNRPEEVIYDCIGLSLYIDTNEFLDETSEVIVCVKPNGEDWKVIKTITIDEYSENYELEVMFDKTMDLEEFCCYPNIDNSYSDSIGMYMPLNLGNADVFYRETY